MSEKVETREAEELARSAYSDEGWDELDLRERRCLIQGAESAVNELRRMGLLAAPAPGSTPEKAATDDSLPSVEQLERVIEAAEKGCDVNNPPSVKIIASAVLDYLRKGRK